MSLKYTTKETLEKFADFIKNKTNTNSIVPDDFKELFEFYNSVKDFTKIYGKKITDMATIANRFSDSFPNIEKYDYSKIMGDLTSYEFLMNYKEWPFHLPEEIRTEKILELQKLLQSKAEKEHFNEENRLFLAQGEDIAGASYQLMPISEIRRKIKKKKRA